MARPLRIEFAGALYHVSARGNARQPIFLHDEDRREFLVILHVACERYRWLCHGYCLMGNHYHLLVETATASLSRGMKLVNGRYSQAFNHRHQREGHVFQGRFTAILVEKQSHLLELCRYIVLNPVRARMVHTADQWPWSSYRATVGLATPHPVLCTDWVLGNFGKDRQHAARAYGRFVRAGRNQPFPWEKLKNQVYLGSDRFVEDVQCKMDPEQSLRDIPRLQKLGPPRPLDDYRAAPDPVAAMAAAYRSGHYTLKQVGDAFGVSYSTVSRAVRKIEACRAAGVNCKA